MKTLVFRFNSNNALITKFISEKDDLIILEVDSKKATLEDNAKGNTRLATVYGTFTEMGSIYSHDIAFAIIEGKAVPIELTEKQKQLKQQVKAIGF